MEITNLPYPMDVILGRGRQYSKHPGNMIFQGKGGLIACIIRFDCSNLASTAHRSFFMVIDLVQSNRLRYLDSSFAAKRDIVAEVMNTIQNSGGRFVRLKGDVWSIIPDSKSRLKVAHAIQYHIRSEFLQSKEESSATCLKPIPGKPLSRICVIRSLREQISKLQNQPTSSAFFKSNQNADDYIPTCNSNVQYPNVPEGVTVVHNHGLVSPFAQKAGEPHISAFDPFVNWRQLNPFLLQNYLPTTLLVTNTRPLWINNEVNSVDPTSGVDGRYLQSVHRSNVPNLQPQINVKQRQSLECVYGTGSQFKIATGSNSISGTGRETYRTSLHGSAVRQNESVNVVPTIFAGSFTQI